ncbi:MAG: YceI family protein [Gemmatimonadaceae bacterium]
MLWNIDPTHANVEFSVKHLAISTVRGAFNSFTASGATNDDGIPTALTMEIDAASISTNNEQRDAHLKSADFFDAANHPKLTFKATKITGTRDDLTVIGDLTIRGVTKPLTFKGEIATAIKDPWGLQRTSLSLSGKISRSEWGLNWNQALEFGGVLVSDDVKLEIEAAAVAQAESGATAAA